MDDGQQRPEARITALIDLADQYLAALPGPGVAEVRGGIARWRGGACRADTRPTNPVLAAHLAPALEVLAQDRPALASAIAAAAPHLGWIAYDLYDPDLIGPDFAQGNTYAALIGPEGCIRSQDFVLGVFLIAPHVFYRDHTHAAPELYAPLTGPHGWRFAPGAALQVRPPHQPVWNPSQQPHAIKVGPVPYLCIYGWTRDVDVPAVVLAAPDWPALEALRLAP